MSYHRSAARKFIIGAFLLVLGVLTPAALEGWRQLYQFHLETDPPVIAINHAPVGVGLSPVSFEVEVSDAKSGLDLVIITREQDGELKEILRKRYDRERTHHDVISVSLPGKESGLLEGSAKINVTAFDRSFLSNRAITSFDFKVDYDLPQVEVLTTQHNAVIGGCELVFYRIKDRDQTVSFVKVGPWLFQGFKAAALDEAFKATPDVYFAFFAIPFDFNEDQDKIRVLVRDQVGNSTTVPMYYHIGDFGRAKRAIKLSDELMTDRVDTLYKQFVTLRAKLNASPVPSVQPATSKEERISRFRQLNEDYRKLLNTWLAQVFSGPKPQRFWDSSFSWLPGRTRSFFGEEQRFSYQDADAGVLRSDGVDLASSTHAPVPASNDGIVIFADDLGIYGKTLIIDHGFGLTSFYSQLSEFAEVDGKLLKEGDRVERGQIIGFTGTTGLSDTDQLHFEMRLLGIPVRPAEWWDRNWIAGHIEQKINEVKKILGVKILTPLN